MAKSNTKRITKAAAESKKQLAYDLFINTDKYQKEIADIVGISEPTLVKWKNEGNWDKQRVLEKASKVNVVRGLYKKLFDIIEANGSADEIAKIASSIEKLEDKKVTIPNLISAYKELTVWVYPKDPEFAKRMNKFMDEFLSEKLNG